MPIPRPSSESRFLLEIDGVTAVVAMEATPPGLKHTPTKYQPGNQGSPIFVRGNYEVEEFTFKHARAIGLVGQQLMAWLIAFANGDFVETRNVRFVTMSEDGKTSIETWEMTDCVPTMYKPDSSSGTGTNVASFSFSLQPTSARLI